MSKLNPFPEYNEVKKCGECPFMIDKEPIGTGYCIKKKHFVDEDQDACCDDHFVIVR